MKKPKSADREIKQSAATYLRDVEALLLKEKQGDAYELLKKGVEKYADDPFLLSYHGYLKACIERRYRSGIEDCTRALSLFQRKLLRDEVDGAETSKSVLYLNLGRAFLAAGKKKLAFEAFNKGLQSDKRSIELQSELQKMGIRKLSPLPFLNRSNPVNEFLGKLMRKTAKQAHQRVPRSSSAPKNHLP
jgi:tetratricopeptide (TPR) repeat protein